MHGYKNDVSCFLYGKSKKTRSGEAIREQMWYNISWGGSAYPCIKKDAGKPCVKSLDKGEKISLKEG